MSTHPLTLQRLTEMMELLCQKYPISIFDKGADMSDSTMKALIKMLKPNMPPPYDNTSEWFDSYKLQLMGVDIHIVPAIPFGEVEPCRCAERGFHKTEGMELTQTLPIEEVKRRYPDATILGEDEK